METNELKQQIPKPDAPINITLTQQMDEEDEIDFLNIFQYMKDCRKMFAWVLALCLLVGVCAPLLLSQFQEPMLTVSSVVTLDYDVPGEKENETRPVTDLTAPDGAPLDLTKITSAYVLQNALANSKLSSPVSIESLRSNIRVEKNLTEASKRQQEIAAKMVEDKSAAAYENVRDVEMTYENKVVVTLTNGFGDEDARKIVLPDTELRALLDQILVAYNEYLVLTYEDKKLPDDEYSVIDTGNQDILESIDQIRTATQNLYQYCDDQTDATKAYRSSRTGRSLAELMEDIQLINNINVEYLYSYVYTESMAKDKNAMITSYEYQLRTARTDLDLLKDNIASMQLIMDQYQNDKIYVSMQDSNTSRSTQTTTDYYNDLVLQQAKNYDEQAELEVTIIDLENKIENLKVKTDIIELLNVNRELKNTLDLCINMYAQVYDHMSEIMNDYQYITLALHSTAYGKSLSFIEASMKKVLIGAALGAVVAFGWWFLKGLGKELKRGRKEEKIVREVKA